MFSSLLVSLSTGLLVHAATAAPQALASSYSLTTSTAFPFPSATQSASDSSALLVQQWSLAKGRIQNGESDMAFVQDPFPNSPPPHVASSSNNSATVLEATYPEGSFSHDTGGAQFQNLWNGTTFQSMLVSYEVAFDSGFDWVKGGKLPGLRGGNNTIGCSGGSQPDGSDCFSARLMWRENGLGEVYAYMPSPNGLCSQKSITCNDDFGISISRGSFSFAAGSWNRISLLVQLNNPGDTANGQIQLYFNDESVISQQNLQLRSTTSLNANGLFFSTFFGGSDESWATPQTTHTYYRNIQMWGSDQPSTLSGSKVNSAATTSLSSISMYLLLAAVLLFIC